LKPPFKADPSDRVFCPKVGHEVYVDSDCHGWAYQNELCHYAENCEAYLQYAERRILESQNVRRINLSPRLYRALREKAKAEGVAPEVLATRIILKNVKGR
jgi:hypothetical protein